MTRAYYVQTKASMQLRLRPGHARCLMRRVAEQVVSVDCFDLDTVEGQPMEGRDETTAIAPRCQPAPPVV